MKICKACGASAEDHQVFCANCGMRLSGAQEAGTKTAAPKTNNPEPVIHNTQIRSTGFQTYLKEEKKLFIIKLWVGLGMLAVGVILCAAVPIMGLLIFVGFIYTIMRGILLWGLLIQAKRSQNELKAKGFYEEAIRQFSSSNLFLIDGHSVYCSSRFVYLPGGIILLLDDICWIYRYEHTARYWTIPIMKQKVIRIFTLQNMYTSLNGTISNEQALGAFISFIKNANPKIAIGYTKQNADYYKDCQKAAGIR